MTREDYIWVAVRVFGLYLAIEAIQAIPGALNAWFALSMAALASSGVAPDATESFFSLARSTMRSRALFMPFEFLFYSLAAWYFLRGAPAIVRFINRNAGAAA